MKDILDRYGYYGMLRLFYSTFISKFFISWKVRIVRVPFYIRGARHIKWGRNFTSGVNLRIDADPLSSESKYVLQIGNNVQVNDYVHIGAVNKVIIGNYVLIASKVFISDHNHGNYNGFDQSHPNSAPLTRKLQSLPIIIEDNVWIGEHVSILPGVTIGKGSIIGANSVVSRSIPHGCIAIGTPARVIKKFNYNTNQWERV